MVLRKTVAVAAACVSLSGVAHAYTAVDTLTLGSGWDPFNWASPDNGTDGGPFLEGACNIVLYNCPSVQFDFTVTGHEVFKVTDAFFPGDQFDVIISNLATYTSVDEGLTTPFTYTGLNAVTDFDAAYADPSFSHGGYLLGPGSYAVTGTVPFTTFGSGQGAVELSVPEPKTWAMMLLGFGLVGGFARRGVRRGALAA